ncbi:autotransporter domain-containing protein [Sphingobium ummariense]
MTIGIKVRRRAICHASLFISSAIALTLAAPGVAQAACTPNPSRAGEKTVCSGEETTRLIVNQAGSTVLVEQDATLSAPDASSILVTFPYNSYWNASIAIQVDGTVGGGTSSAIAVQSYGNLGSSDNVAFTISETGRISGPTGIDLLPPTGVYPYYRGTAVSVENGGVISSTAGGLALHGADDGASYFSSILNRSTGTIGAIQGRVGTLINEGLIDGAALSAFAKEPASQYYTGLVSITNRGVIRANGSADTLLLRQNDNITNEGDIFAEGTGRAISGASLWITNQDTGSIVATQTAISVTQSVEVHNNGVISGAEDAIVSDGSLTLTNRGSIQGNIRGGDAASFIDNIGGTIDGDILLGAGNDVFIGDVDRMDQPFGTVTGRVDAGGGNDMLVYNFLKDSVLDSPVSKPDTIETVSLRVGRDSTLTLSESFFSTEALTLGGADVGYYNTRNEFVLAGSIDTQGPALLEDNYNSSGFVISQMGTIVAHLSGAGSYAANLRSASLFDNSGTITAIGGSGVAGTSTRISNNGTITADATAVRAWYGLDNSGVIRSSQGVGADIVNDDSSNSGTIEGVTVGVRVQASTFVNSGTISSAGHGLEIGSNGTVINQSTGVITGGAAGVSTPADDMYRGGIQVINAGIIRGNVDLGGQRYYGGSGNVFAALSGSTVDGDIYLGSGYDMFATSLVNNGPGEFAGLTGRVTGTGPATLRYFVDADTTTAPALKGFFSDLSYQLSNDATLTLTGSNGVGLSVAGSGQVVLTGDMTGTTDRSLIDLTAMAIALDGADQPPANTIAMTNNGTITFRQGTFSYGTAIGVGEGNSFTNNGTIDVRVGISLYGPYGTAISGGTTVVNNGVIRLSGSTGIRTSFTPDAILRNAGVIEQVGGGALSVGVNGSGTILNTGSIETEGSAIVISEGPAFLSNSGILRSSAGHAVSSTDYYYASRVWNQVGGLIAGGPGVPAIALSSGSILANEGTIQGDVILRYDPYGYGYDSGSSIFINRGGTLNGNLMLSKNDDIVIALNGDTGVSGTIDTLAGIDTFVHAYDKSTTVALDAGIMPPAGFEDLGFAAYGTDTVLTLTGERSQTRPLFLAGDGTIVNDIVMNETGATGPTSITLGSATDPANSVGAGSTLTFVNRATLARGVAGYARALDNQGTIMGSDMYRPAIQIVANDPTGFSFRNSGTVAGADVPQNAYGGDWYAVSIDRMATVTSARNSFDNSGQIIGGALVTANTRSFSFVNSGRITSSNPYYAAAVLTVGPRYNLEYPSTPNADDASILNSGTIDGKLTATLSARRVTVMNSGVIHGSVYVNQPGRLDGYDQFGYPAETHQDSLSFTNNGSVLGATVSSAAVAMDIANSGRIGQADTAQPQGTALSVVIRADVDRAVRITNDGSIVGTGAAASGIVVGAYSGEAEESTRVPPNSTLTLTNRGTITADDGAGFSPPPYGYGPKELIGATAVGIMAPGDGASEVSIVNAQGATISASGSTSYLPRYWGQGDAPPTVPEGYLATGSLAVGVLADKVSLDNAGTIRGNAGGMIDADTVISWNDYALDLSEKFLAGAVQTFHSVDTVVNRSTGVIIGSIDLGDGDDSLINAGKIDGDIYLRAGDDSMTHNIGGALTGTVDGGDGIDKAVIDITGGGLLNQKLLAHFVNFESKLISGSGTVKTDGPFTEDTLFLRDATLTLGAGQTLQTAGPVAVTFAGGTNSLVNNGTIVGGLDLTNGRNQLVNAGTITGSILFGQDSRVTGLAGSVISGRIDVPKGAVFASAGTVNGAIAVSGTLAPGASPGTMTVNGNVTLNAGSNALFEFTPTVSDALVINGFLAIKDGAKLTLTGNRPLTPGVYTIVRASDGITGSFGTNIMRDETVAGVLSFGAKEIQLTGLFQLRTGALAQVERTKDYLNTLLLGGKATPGMLSAFPGMVDAEGYGNEAALSTLSPEAYASAAQIGIENGLAISGALRSVQMARLGDEAGLFAFGQAYGNGRTFDADARGTAQADVDSSGYLGGLGYGNSTLGAALFVGNEESKQRLGGTAMSNDADGLFFGGRLHYANGGLSAGATLIFDRAKVDTSRNPAGGSATGSHYDLHSTTIDGWLSYGFAIRSGWRAGPQIGLTRVSVKRDAASESGGAFALNVAKQTYDATFLSADLKLEAPSEESLSPWVAVGMRHKLDGDAIDAAGSFLGTNTAYTVVGVERKKTLPHAAGGLNMVISAKLSIFVNGDVEFSGRNGQQHVNGGVTFKF